MRWLLWCLLAPQWILLDGLLAQWLPFRLDLGAVLALVLALDCRPGSTAALLAWVALARGVLQDGDAALHFLALGLPVAALLPLRAVLDERFWPVRAAVTGLFVVAVPRLTVVFAELSGQSAAPLRPGLAGVLATMLCAPFLAAVLRRLPPLGSFAEVVER